MAQKTASTEHSIPVLKILSRSWIFILLVTILCSLLCLGYSISQVPPTYTATRSLILRTEILESGMVNNQSANEAELAKKHFKRIEAILKSSKLNEEYNGSVEANPNGLKINNSAIKMVYGEKSLIFRLSYTDATSQLAEDKLDVIIAVLKTTNEFNKNTPADKVEFVLTQKQCEITSNTSHQKFTLIGAGVGLVISVAISFLVYSLDNTIRDKNEFEELTGVNVIAYINKDKEEKKQKRR